MTWEEIGMTPEQFVATIRESPQGPQYEAGLVCLYHQPWLWVGTLPLQGDFP